jgi:pyrroloquinoline quinone biosynthesis protein B
MHIRVLGAAAGGGFPQWNCNCRNCDGVRRGRLRARARTQSSLAISGDGRDWVLCNASPDVAAQIRAFPALQPARELRDTALCGVVLVDAQIDHTTGLLMLREGPRLAVYCTAQVHEDLTHGNPIFTVLGHFCGVDWHPVVPDGRSSFQVAGARWLSFTAVPLTSKPPPFSPHRDAPRPGDNIGLQVRDVRTQRTLFYAPGVAAIEPHLWPLLTGADCVMLDGTFWTDDELIGLGISSKRAADMGHLPQSGPGGMLEALARLPAARKILIHINNTNPILDEESPERARLREAGVEVAHDGMEITL